MKKRLRLWVLMLSLICLVSIVGCQSQPEPVSSEEPSSVTADLPESGQEPTSSQVEEPVSSEPSVVESKPEPSMAESEPDGSSQPELSLVPFTLHEINLSAGNVLDDNSNKGDLVLSTFKIKPTDSLFERPGESFEATLIRNAEELKQAGFSMEALDETKPNPLSDQAAYFEKSVLILVLAHHTSTTIDEQFNSITRSGTQLIINWSMMPFDGTPSKESQVHAMTDGSEHMIYWLEVQRSDVEGITEIIGRRSSQAE